MTRLHRRFAHDPVKVVLEGYRKGFPKRADAQEKLGQGKGHASPLDPLTGAGANGWSVALIATASLSYGCCRAALLV